MLVEVHFPIADLRPFSSQTTRRLNRPNWLLPEPGRDFLRSSGPITERRRGGLSPWAGEDVFGSAAHAIRFPPGFPELAATAATAGLTGRVAFRRWFSDGSPAVRLQIGISLTRRHSFRPLDADRVAELLRGVLRFPVRLPSHLSDAYFELGHSSVELGTLYARATSTHCGSEEEDGSALVVPGRPWLLVAHARDQVTSFPRGSSSPELDWSYDLGVVHYRIPSLDDIDVWHLWHGKKGSDDRDGQRRLRLHVTRLLTEVAVGRKVLWALASGLVRVEPDSPEKVQLEHYLKRFLRILKRKKAFGFSSSALLASVQRVEDLVRPGQRESLLAAIQSVRRSYRIDIERILNRSSVVYAPISAKSEGGGGIMISQDNVGGDQTGDRVESHISGGSQVRGDVVVAKTIKNSFNPNTQIGASDDIKALLDELDLEVAKLAAQVEPVVADQMQRDADAARKELESEAPRRKWYNLSLSGILEAAQKTGEAGAAIVVLVEKMLRIS